MYETKLHLYRGDKMLGTVTHTTDDFPWHWGTFGPSQNFLEVKHLFDKELSLVESGELDDKWEEIWSEINTPELHLVSVSGEKEITNFLIHINGNETWWRE